MTMKSCDQHDRCTVVYSEDWRSGQNGCPMCNLQSHSDDRERQYEKAVDEASDKYSRLQDELNEALEAVTP